MTKYSGISTDPEGRIREHKKRFKNIRNVKIKKFSSRQKAQDWEDRQPGYHHPGGKRPKGRKPTFGYQFDHSGKK